MAKTSSNCRSQIRRPPRNGARRSGTAGSRRSEDGRLPVLEVGGQRHRQAIRHFVERTRATHVLGQRRLPHFGVDDAARRRDGVDGVGQMEAVEGSQAHVADDEVETERGELPAGRLELEMMVDLRHLADGFLNDVGKSRVRFDQEHHLWCHREAAAPGESYRATAAFTTPRCTFPDRPLSLDTTCRGRHSSWFVFPSGADLEYGVWRRAN